MHYSPRFPHPTMSTFYLRGRGRAGGALRTDVEYTFAFQTDHETGLAYVDTPLTQVNEFDDSGRPTNPEQDAAVVEAFTRLGVPYAAVWTTSYEFAAEHVARVAEALRPLLEGATLTRPSESYYAS